MDLWRQEKTAETDPTWGKRVAMDPIWATPVEMDPISESPEAMPKKRDFRYKWQEPGEVPKQGALWSCLSDNFSHWGSRALDY